MYTWIHLDLNSSHDNINSGSVIREEVKKMRENIFTVFAFEL